MPTIQVNNIHMYYEIHGQGEPLVLIGGLSNDVSDYATMIPWLAQKYRVIAFDNRGVGRTDKPDAPYSIKMMADDTAGLLSSLGIKQAHVLGVSMGGRIAIELALQHPVLVKSLILASTYAERQKRMGLAQRLVTISLHIPLLRGSRKYPQPYYAVVRQRQASRCYDASDRLHEIGVPTLILHGRNDRIAPYQLAEEMHNGIRSSKMITFDGGHIFLFLRQKQFLNAVVDFLDAQTAKSPNSG